MRYLNFVILITLVFFLTDCVSYKVITDFDPTQDFSTYKTYRWAKSKERDPEDMFSKNPKLRKKIQVSVNKVLQRKGFELLEVGDPDFIVILHGGVKQKVQVHHHRSYWYHPWWGPYGGYTTVSRYEEGTLVIDIVDRTEKELSWRGLATGIAQSHVDADYLQEDLDEIISKILDSFPPGKI